MSKEKKILKEILKTVKNEKLKNYRLDGFFDLVTGEDVVFNYFLPRRNKGFIIRDRKNVIWKDFILIWEMRKLGIECVILTYNDFSDNNKLKRHFPLVFKSLELMLELQEMYLLHPYCRYGEEAERFKAQKYLRNLNYDARQKAEVDLQIRRKKCQENGVELVIV